MTELRPTLTASRLREVLHYDPLTGIFKWRVSLRNGKSPGDIAGALDGYGYFKIGLNERLYLSHRLAWLYMTGEWPPTGIDHINGEKGDNKWNNLRLASDAENAQNQRRAQSNSKSGILGVHPRPNGRYEARIRIAGKSRYLGTFSTTEEAYAVYVQAKRELHPMGTL